MAQTHNTFFRALNAIYHQCLDILPGTEDAADMLTYCSIVYDFIHQHQLHEEGIFFSGIEKATGIPGLMDVNISQHDEMDSGLEKFRHYAEKTSKDDYNGNTLRQIIDDFAPLFESHNHAEITTIISLYDKIDSDTLKSISDKMWETAERDSDMFKAAPLVLGCQDKTFIIDGDLSPYPEVPFIAKFVTDWVLSRRHGKVWRFNPSNGYGEVKKFPPPVTKSLLHGNDKSVGRKVTKGAAEKAAGGYKVFVPIFAAIVSLWSVMTFFIV
jgi:hypothetical protein